MFQHGIRSARLRAVSIAIIAAATFPLAACGEVDESAVRATIVNVARSQIGFRENPVGSNCNPYSAGFHDECWEWCSDFAAWTWINADVPVTYGWGPGQLNVGSVSFYKYAVAHGTWHPVESGYVPQPGDAVIFGLNGAGTFSAHVAIVVSAGSPGVNAVNGNSQDGVIYVTNQTATSDGLNLISGYASPDL